MMILASSSPRDACAGGIDDKKRGNIIARKKSSKLIAIKSGKKKKLRHMRAQTLKLREGKMTSIIKRFNLGFEKMATTSLLL